MAILIFRIGVSVDRDITKMLQFVRVADHINRDNFAIFDLQRGGLQQAPVFDRDETGQAVDEGIADEPRRPLGKSRGQGSVKLHDAVESDNRLQ